MYTTKRDFFLPASPHGELSPTKFAPTSTQLAANCLKFIFLLPWKNDNIVPTMRRNHTKHVYFSFFTPLKATGELESLALEGGGGKLAMGWNRYHSVVHGVFRRVIISSYHDQCPYDCHANWTEFVPSQIYCILWKILKVWTTFVQKMPIALLASLTSWTSNQCQGTFH